MAFVDNFRLNMGGKLPAPTNQLQINQPRGYVPENTTVPGPKQTFSVDPNSTMMYLVNEYNKANSWDDKIGIVNAMMENFPNPDDSLKNWIKRLDAKTQEGYRQSKTLSWAMNEYNKTPDLDKKEQIVNYLMETYPNPSKWLRSRIIQLDKITRQMRAFQDGINSNIRINDLGDHK